MSKEPVEYFQDIKMVKNKIPELYNQIMGVLENQQD